MHTAFILFFICGIYLGMVIHGFGQKFIDRTQWVLLFLVGWCLMSGLFHALPVDKIYHPSQPDPSDPNPQVLKVVGQPTGWKIEKGGDFNGEKQKEKEGNLSGNGLGSR